jgi:hypothetical protein
LALIGCGVDPQVADGDGLAQTTGALKPLDLSVEFSNCTEFAGIGYVPTANARPLVPAHYALAGDATNALIVVRAVDCDGVSVNGSKAKKTRLSQIGLMVTGQDTSASINNYTLWYATDNAVLHAKLNAAGADTNVDENLKYKFEADGSGGGTLAIRTTPPSAPNYHATGPVVVPTAAPVPFTATWWFDGNRGTLSMRTPFAALKFGGATLTLTTPKVSALAKLIGATTLEFPALNSYNAFADATMTVTLQ